MIDTIRLYAYLSDYEKQIIENISTVTSSYDNKKQELKYRFTQTNLKGSWDTSIQIKVAEKIIYKEKMTNKIIIECSLHKLILGHNCYGGSLDIIAQVQYLLNVIYKELKIYIDIKEVEVARLDIAQVFKLDNQEQANSYIYQFKKVPYKNKISIDYDGTVMWKFSDYSIKLYNKFKEFMVHDMKPTKFKIQMELQQQLDQEKDKEENKQDQIKIKRLESEIKKYTTTTKFINNINGIIRIELTIRKKKLQALHDLKQLTVFDINIKMLMQYMKTIINEISKNVGYHKTQEKAQDIEQVKNRLYDNIKSKRKATLLLNFYILARTIGLDALRNTTSKATYYRNLRLIKENGIDLFNDAKPTHIYENTTFPKDFNIVDDTYQIKTIELDEYLNII